VTFIWQSKKMSTNQGSGQDTTDDRDTIPGKKLKTARCAMDKAAEEHRLAILIFPVTTCGRLREEVQRTAENLARAQRSFDTAYYTEMGLIGGRPVETNEL
jgi:hypothetical protein